VDFNKKIKKHCDGICILKEKQWGKQEKIFYNNKKRDKKHQEFEVIL